MAWFSTGKDAESIHDEEEARRERKQAAAKNKVERFWMPAPEVYGDGSVEASTARITFLDGLAHPKGFKTPFVFMEHGLCVDGGYRGHQYTCAKKAGGYCYMCEMGDVPYLAAAYTVIDHREWTSRDGTVHKDELKLFVCKSQVLKILRQASVKRKGLRGWTADVQRSKSKAPNTGDMFDWDLERVSIPDNMQPYDYIALLAPPSTETIKAILGHETASHSSSDYEGVQDDGSDLGPPSPDDFSDDDIPF